MKISMWKALSCVCAVAALTTMAVVAKDVRTISVRDECDPATFNAALQDPATCVGDGETSRSRSSSTRIAGRRAREVALQ